MLFALMAFAGSAQMVLAGSPLAPSGQTLYKKALSLTREGDYAQALGFIKEAKRVYSREGNAEGTYRSAALAHYFNYEDQSLKTRWKNPPPQWLRLGWLLKDFKYSGSYIIPPVSSTSYQGLLLFARKVRDIPQGPGRSVPIWGILDVKTLPRLKPGEEVVGGSCQLKGKAFDPGIAAIVMVKGHQNQEKYYNIRKAWHLNTRTSKIETLPSKQVVCTNEGWGV